MKNWPARLALVCIVIVGACEPAPTSTPPPSPAPAPTPAPGPTPPPAPPGEYPQAATVDLATLVEVLPKDSDGKPILFEVGGVNLTVGAPRKDPVGAAARCRDLVTSCNRVTRDMDRCVADVPRCGTPTPWDEEAACCASACASAFQEERRLGASILDASNAIFGSTHECFPGLVEMYVGAGGTPELAPRRAR